MCASKELGYLHRWTCALEATRTLQPMKPHPLQSSFHAFGLRPNGKSIKWDQCGVRCEKTAASGPDFTGRHAVGCVGWSDRLLARCIYLRDYVYAVYLLHKLHTLRMQCHGRSRSARGGSVFTRSLDTSEKGTTCTAPIQKQ